MAKVMTFKGRRQPPSRLPLGLSPHYVGEAQAEPKKSPDVQEVIEAPADVVLDTVEEIEAEKVETQTEQDSESALDSLALAGIPEELAQEILETESIDESIETDSEIEVDLDAAVDLDALSKPELQELATSLGLDPSGRIDYLRNRIRKALEEN